MSLEYSSDSLPKGDWKTEEIFQEPVELPIGLVYAAGIHAENSQGYVSFGSSIDLISPASALEKARFEFLERKSTLEVYYNPNQNVPIFDKSLRKVSLTTSSEIFSKSLESDCRYSISNGVALFSNIEEAAMRATQELVERDAILRSWFGESIPKKIPLTSLSENPYYASMRGCYEISLFEIGEVSVFNQKLTTVCVLCTSKNSSIGHTYGFACQNNRDSAFNHALKEALQRLTFLFNEPIEDAPLKFSPSPEYHLDFYRKQAGLLSLIKWLDGNNFCEKKFTVQNFDELRFVDISSRESKGDYFVIKAMCPSLLGLHFGKNQYDFEGRPHPIA